MIIDSAKSTPASRPADQTRAFSAALGGLIAIAGGIGIGRFVYTPILPPMVEALGLSKSQAGLIASANFLGYLVGGVLVGLPSLPGGQRRWLLGGLAMSALTTAAMGLVTTAPGFLVLRFVGGVASAFVLIIASAFVLEYLSKSGRDELSPVHFAGVGSGIAVSAALVSMLSQLGQPWRVLWWASGALSAAALVAAILLLPNVAETTHPSRRQGGTPLDPRLRWLIVGYGFYGFGYVITATFLVAIVRATPSIRTLEPVTWIVFGLAAAPSIVLWTRIAARIGLPAAFAWACVVEAVGVMASVAWPSAVGVFIAAILVGGTFMGLTALGLIRGRELARGDPRRALAFLTTSFGVGQIVGPYFAGIVSDHLGSFMLPSAVAAAALIVAAVLATI